MHAVPVRHFAPCFCPYAKWEVVLALDPATHQVRVIWGSGSDTILLSCCMGGLFGAALTAEEYQRVRQHGQSALDAAAASSYQVVDVSPPTAVAIPVAEAIPIAEAIPVSIAPSYHNCAKGAPPSAPFAQIAMKR